MSMVEVNKDEETVISIERAILLLKKDGIIVSAEQAEIIVKFLTVFAKITVAQYLRSIKFEKK